MHLLNAIRYIMALNERKNKAIYDILTKYEIAPLVYTIIENQEKFCYERDAINPALVTFVESRSNDGRDTPLNDTAKILQGDVFAFTCIGEEQKLKAVYAALKETYNCIF